MHAAVHTGRNTSPKRTHDERTDLRSTFQSADTSGAGAGSSGNANGCAMPKCTDEQITSALVNALKSPEFGSAPQLRAFLEFVVRASLEDQHEKIKGYTIAVEALGRGEDFNPVTDPIVRVEAARLRRRLAKYYGGSGASDSVRISIPKGSYAPAFKVSVDPESPENLAAAPDTGINETLDDNDRSAVEDLLMPAVEELQQVASPPARRDTSLPAIGAPGVAAESFPASVAAAQDLAGPQAAKPTQPLFQKRVSIPVVAVLSVACFLAGLLAGSFQ
ncbi:hypothetical protein [uncultured Roseibium sp.]|uniref:hypothetical protein n=1 Tax=uncultured Roseibium sp. TaxID=1936171 RepID=UPI0026194AE2|nr:hypothetical protein [uncultured Roseibium sp.]